jgi:transposase
MNNGSSGLLRQDNGMAVRATCRRFIDLCRRLNLFRNAVAAIDPRDKNFTRNKLKKRIDQLEASIEHYMLTPGGQLVQAGSIA